MALAGTLVAVAGSLSGCGAHASAATGPAPATGHQRGRLAPLRVAVSVYPLAQLVSYLGGADVRVVDMAPPGVAPRSLALGPAQRAMVRSAGLVLDVGDGYQPQVEAAARSARRHLSVLPAVSGQTQPYEFWLDPYLMAKAAVVVANGLTAADPGARQQFQNGSRDFQAVAASIESDFESTFTQCQNSYFVTADDAFGRMAASFALVDVPVNTAGAQAAEAAIAYHNLPDVFSEVGVRSPALGRVARSAGVGVKSLDPMELAPAEGTRPFSYFAVMEEDLTAMEGPLACSTSDNYS